MNKPIWREMALAGLQRHIPPEKRDAVRSSIDLSFIVRRSLAAERLSKWHDRDLNVTQLYMDRDRSLRILFERTHPVTIWALSIKIDPITE